MTPENPPQVVAYHLQQSCVGLDGGAARMGCEDHVLNAALWRVDGERLDLESGACQVSEAECFDKGLFVHDRPASGADEEGAATGTPSSAAARWSTVSKPTDRMD